MAENVTDATNETEDEATTTMDGGGGEISTGKNSALSTGNFGGELMISKEDFEMLDDAFQSNIADGELQFSRLAIAQPLSPEVANNEPGWQAGMLFDNITREIYSTKGHPPWLVGKGSDDEDLPRVNFCLSLPIAKLPTEFIKWIPRDEGGGIEWKTLDRNDPRVKEGVWQKDGGNWGMKPSQQSDDGRSLPPPVTVNYNFLNLMIDHESGFPKSSFIVVSYNRTSAIVGSKFANLLSRHRLQMMPIFGMAYWFYTKSLPHPESGGVYYIHQVTKGPLLQNINPGLVELCLPMAKKLSEKGSGRELQERILNAAILEPPEEGSSDGVDGGVSDSDSSEEPAF